MKKIRTAIIILFLVNNLDAQSWLSSSQITSNSDIMEHASVIDDNGDVIVFGSFDGNLILPDGTELLSYGSRDYYLVKFLPDGTLDWIKNFGSPAADWVTGGLDLDANGNIYVTGAFQGTMNYSETGTLTSSGTQDAFLIKLDAQGNVDWARNIGQGFFFQYTNTLNIDNAGDVLIAGNFRDSIVFNESVTLYSIPLKWDGFFAKFSSTDGDLSWAKHISTLNGSQGLIRTVESNANNYYISGVFVDTLAFESDTLTSEYTLFNTFLAQTDLNGNVTWLRKIEGNDRIYGYSTVLDDEGNIYIASFYESDTIYIETSDSNFQEVIENNGDYDMYVVKYSPSGDMFWYRSIGGEGNDRLFSLEFFDDKIWTAGYISDTVQWGGIELAPTATSGQDMFTGAFTKDGDPRDANITRGEGLDESRAIFQNGDQLYTVMRSTSENLRIGEEIYDTNGGAYYIVLGVIGCLPITVGDLITTDIADCYGDSTGMIIQTVPSGGFGAPWRYSIDNGATSSESQVFTELPAGDYQIVVSDKEGCTQTGPLTTLNEPDAIMISVTDVDSVLCHGGNNGAITIDVTGGTAPYYYSSDSGQVFSNDIDLLSQLSAGTYTIAVRDDKSCIAFAPSDTIFEPDTLEVTDVDLSDILCFGESTGTITINALGGTAPLTFSVNNGGVYADNPLFTDLPAGDYQIVVQDAHNCVAEGPATSLVQPDRLQVIDVDLSDILCHGDSTGTIEISALGGTAPLTFSVDDGGVYADNPLFADLPAGDYLIMVQDANDCVAEGPVTSLVQPDTLEAIFVSKEDILHHTTWEDEVEITEGSLTVAASGGTAQYTYQLLPGGSPQALGTFFFPFEDSGKYVVAVYDINGCGPANTDTIEINVEYSSQVGVDDFGAAEVKIYPNPTSGIVTLEVPFEGNKTMMEVISMTGQTVLKQEVFPNGGVITETLDLSDQAKGMYMVRIDGKSLPSAIMVK